MQTKTVCGLTMLGFILALILPANCFKLSTTKFRPELLTTKSIMADKSNSSSDHSGSLKSEAVHSASVQNETNMSANINLSVPYSLKINTTDCDRSRKNGVVVMISFNHFGFPKSNYLMQTTLDIMKKMRNEGSLVRLIIDDSTPSENTPGSLAKNDWVLTSMIRKLRVETFSPVHAWEMNVFGFLFLDKTIDFSDPTLLSELRRVTFHGIHLYLIIVGEDFDMSIIKNYQIKPEEVIIIPSYEILHSSLPSKLFEKLCVRKSKSNIDIA